MRPPRDRPETVKRVTVPEAAETLGLTTDAVRSRLRRGKLRKEKDAQGTVYVLLDGDKSDGQLDKSTNQRLGQPTVELVEALEDQIDLLKDEVSAWREEARRKDHIIAALTERIPELPAPPDTHSDTPGSPQKATEEPYKGEASQGEKRPAWWRRLFR